MINSVFKQSAQTHQHLESDMTQEELDKLNTTVKDIKLLTMEFNLPMPTNPAA